jgi:endonuclease-3 related protein
MVAGRPGSRRKLLTDWYAAMLGKLGRRRWWPADTPFEVAVGAILTQNTAWRNVDLALARLRDLQALSPLPMRRLGAARLEEAIRPSGFFRQKAVRLGVFLDFLETRGGLSGAASDDRLACLAGEETEALRDDLLALRGIGPETADCILLYGLGRPSFVVDAYTRRILGRHGLLAEDAGYDELRDFFMDALPRDAEGAVEVYNEYHAQLVRIGHTYCKKAKPLCGECPLGQFLEYEPL